MPYKDQAKKNQAQAVRRERDRIDYGPMRKAVADRLVARATELAREVLANRPKVVAQADIERHRGYSGNLNPMCH